MRQVNTGGGNNNDVELAKPLNASGSKDADEDATATAASSVGGDVTPKDGGSPVKPSSAATSPIKAAAATGEDKQSAKSVSKAISSCLLYSFCSVSMTLVNKSLASSYNHLIQGNGDLNILLVVWQAVVAVISVDFCRRLKWVEYPDLNMQTVRVWAMVNCLFCLMLFTAMAALQYNSVAMVTVFKNVNTTVTTIGDWIIYGSTCNLLIIFALMLMLGGAVLAAGTDIHTTPLGLFWMCANALSTSSYILYTKHVTETVKMSKFGMVYANNLLCIVFLLPIAVALGQVQTFIDTPPLHTVDYVGKNVFAGLIGFILNFASLTCIHVNGPTTYAIVGSLNRIPIIIFGSIMFHAVISRKTWFFIVMCILGGFVYSYAMIREKQKKALQQQKS